MKQLVTGGVVVNRLVCRESKRENRQMRQILEKCFGAVLPVFSRKNMVLVCKNRGVEFEISGC